MNKPAFLKKLTPTHVVVFLLLAAFIYVQWPTRIKTKISEAPYLLSQPQLGFTIQFEKEPKQESTEMVLEDGKKLTATMFVAQRKGLDQMAQAVDLGDQDPQLWLADAKSIDSQEFNGRIVLEFEFAKGFNGSTYTITEYAVKNHAGFVNHVRVMAAGNKVYKWSVGYKDKDDSELQTRILTFLDSFSLTQESP